MTRSCSWRSATTGWGELTPAGGAPDVLPGEYSYTLPPGTARSLHGDYRFRVRVLGTAGGALTAESPRFTMR